MASSLGLVDDVRVSADLSRFDDELLGLLEAGFFGGCLAAALGGVAE